MPEQKGRLRFEIDHVIAIKHRGEAVEENLTLACPACNRAKGTNISGVDPESGRIIRLFHPRKDRWNRHFAWDGPYLRGRTRIGRATVDTLNINQANRVHLRRALIAEGVFPTG